ncbi:LamG domain-containing protein [Candidatus Poribacteria bacterium]
MKVISILTVLISVLLICGTAFASPKVDKNTMVLLSFDEGVGDTAQDLSGNENHGELNGAEWVEGKFGSAIELDTDRDSVVMPLSPTLDLVEELTVEAWIKTSTVDIRTDIISKHEGGGYALIIDAGGIFRASFHIAGAYTPSRSATALEADQWYYLAATYDGESLNVYIDGELEGEVPVQGAVTSTVVPLSIGGNSGPGGVTDYFYKGAVDELRVSDIARTPDELKLAMESASPVFPSGKLATTWARIRIAE